MALLEPGSEPALRNILLLDKSEHPLPLQIDEACAILGISIPDHVSSSQVIQEASSSHGPREEWTLRWLLKKLEGTGSDSQSPYLETRLWQLIKELVRRLPVANLARLLRTHHFIDVLLKTLKSLQKALLPGGTPTRQQLQSSVNATSRESSAGAGSSSATLDDSVDQHKRGQKRKRDGTPIEHHRKINASEIDIRLLYESICGVVEQVQGLSTDDSYGYATEHLKKALEAPPEQAAEILGASLALMNFLLETDGDTRTLEEEDSIRRCVDPFVKIWKSRASRTININQELLFSKTSFLPALKLLSTLDDAEIRTSGVGTEVHVIENLLLQHIVFPCRESFESSKRNRAAQEDGAPRIDVDQLLAPLRALPLHCERSEHSQIKQIHPVTKFYNIVLRHTPLTTQKQRISESSWLESLFDRLAFQEVNPNTDAPQSAIASDASDIVRSMLDMLAEKKLKLHIPTLEKVLSRFSHLLEGDHAQVDWAIIGSCLAINPDIFVIPIISKDPSGQRTRASNQYLCALFARINETSSSSDSTHEAGRKFIQEDVLVSLVKGFAQARDLLGFIEHWKSNLMLTVRPANQSENPLDSSHGDHKAVSEAESGPNVWENEDLLQEVAAQIEGRLTIGQLQATFKELSTAFAPTNITQGAEQLQSTAASLVIFDCLLTGCRVEDTVRQLTEIIEDLYQTLLVSCEADTLPYRYSWRAWRCMSTIKSRWKAELHPSLQVQEVEERLAKKALNMVAQPGSSISAEDLLQSLSFMLSMIEVLGSSPQRNELASSAVKAVMEGSQQSNESFKLEVSKMLCLRPSALQGSTPDLQRSFFEHLFEFSREGFTGSKPELIRPVHNLNYVVWQQFLHSRILEEDEVLAKNFRAFQIDSFLAIKVDDSGKLSGKDQATYSAAFDSIHQTTPRAFDRKQRTRIFNHILEHLLEDEFLSPQVLKDHLKLLVNILSYPNTSMILIRDTFNLAQDRQEPRPRKASLLNLVKALSSRSRSPYLDTEVVNLFKQIVRKVVGSQLSKGMDEPAVLHLKSYLEALNPGRYHAADLDILTLVLLGASLDFYRAHFKDFPEELQCSLENLPYLYMDFAKIVCRFVHIRCTSTTTLSNICQASVAASMLVRFADEVVNSGEAESLTADLQDLLSKALGHDYQFYSSEDEQVLEQAVKKIRETQHLLGKSDISDPLDIDMKDVDASSIREQRSTISQSIGSRANLDREKRASIITGLLNEGADTVLSRNELLVLQRLIVSRAGTGNSTSEGFLTALACVVNHLCDALLQPLPFQVSVLSLQNLNSILEKYPRIITQWHIDQIMAVITTCASRLLSSKSYTPKQNSLLFLGLCRVFSTTLAFHRKRLGGRYHLILPALQCLLRPLFIPFTVTRADTSDTPQTISTGTYTSTHASSYSRLLLQIADPSLSSVTPRNRSNDKSHNLNDATKTAKSIAGQHLHYLVMTYCECQLKGRLEKEVREQLKPGLWAVLDVIPQEVMRVMNIAMGKEGRVVWKAVYSEWRREKGGNGR